jgi:hypothetical protein
MGASPRVEVWQTSPCPLRFNPDACASRLSLVLPRFHPVGCSVFVSRMGASPRVEVWQTRPCPIRFNPDARASRLSLVLPRFHPVGCSVFVSRMGASPRVEVWQTRPCPIRFNPDARAPRLISPIPCRRIGLGRELGIRRLFPSVFFWLHYGAESKFVLSLQECSQ